MSLQDTMYNGWLASQPTDPIAAQGYSALLEHWETIGEGKCELPTAQFNAWRREVRPLLTTRELSFFDEPLEDGLGDYPDLVQAKMTGRLSKILLDRRYKAAKENGGLG